MSRKGGDVRFSFEALATGRDYRRHQDKVSAGGKLVGIAGNGIPRSIPHVPQRSFRKDPPVARQSFICARMVDSVVSPSGQRHSLRQLLSSDNLKLCYWTCAYSSSNSFSRWPIKSITTPGWMPFALLVGLALFCCISGFLCGIGTLIEPSK
jgi:hypothetical protein